MQYVTEDAFLSPVQCAGFGIWSSNQWSTKNNINNTFGRRAKLYISFSDFKATCVCHIFIVCITSKGNILISLLIGI